MADLDATVMEHVVAPDAEVATHLPTPGLIHAPPVPVEYFPIAHALQTETSVPPVPMLSVVYPEIHDVQSKSQESNNVIFQLYCEDIMKTRASTRSLGTGTDAINLIMIK